jgi:hypothetical protein
MRVKWLSHCITHGKDEERIQSFVRETGKEKTILKVHEEVRGWIHLNQDGNHIIINFWVP